MLAETLIAETVLGSGALATGGFLYVRSRRARLYRELASRIAHITRAREPDLAAVGSRSLPGFADGLAVVPDFLPAASFAALAGEAERLAAPERSFVPTHKQGGTVAYETLIAAAPAIVACYHSAVVRDMVSRLVGTPIRPTPIHDQSSLSVLVYNKPGDHIGWHYDHNFYRGRHFTVLLAIHNAGRAAHGLSHAVLKARLPGREIEISTAANTLVVFEGARVRHKVTPIHDGERRLVLSMTYCTDPRSTWWQGWSRRLKDTAFFGLRALWT
jgi:2OG-Fe(II) oxygenase superfamily